MKRKRKRDNNTSVPESQHWTLKEPHKTRIEKGLAWAAETPARATDLKKLLLHVREQNGKDG